MDLRLLFGRPVPLHPNLSTRSHDTAKRALDDLAAEVQLFKLGAWKVELKAARASNQQDLSLSFIFYLFLLFLLSHPLFLFFFSSSFLSYLSREQLTTRDL